MSVDIKSKAIKMAADLLRRRPSTDKDDFPNVPNYYFHHVDHYAELGRRAAIMLRDMVSTIKRQQSALDALHDSLSELKSTRDDSPPLATISLSEVIAMLSDSLSLADGGGV